MKDSSALRYGAIITLALAMTFPILTSKAYANTLDMAHYRVAQGVYEPVALTVEEALNLALKHTNHASWSIVKRAFSKEEIIEIITNGKRFLQWDKATVCLNKGRKGLYDFVVVGGEGIITAVKKKNIKDIRGFAKRYIWEIYIR